MKILMHICCGPCAIYPTEVLRDEGRDLTGYFANPNIHPYSEYQRRRDTLDQWAAGADLPVIHEAAYDPASYFRQVAFRESERCRICYFLRLSRAARFAAGQGFSALTTTLLYSKYQRHDLIAEIGRQVSREHDLEFIYRDFRQGWSLGVRRSKELGLYRQQYCGCLFSEMERYADRKPR